MKILTALRRPGVLGPEYLSGLLRTCVCRNIVEGKAVGRNSQDSLPNQPDHLTLKYPEYIIPAKHLLASGDLSGRGWVSLTLSVLGAEKSVHEGPDFPLNMRNCGASGKVFVVVLFSV